MEYGYEIAEAVLEQYDFYKGASKDRMLDILYILADLENHVHDKWVRNALGRVAEDYVGRFEGESDPEFLYRFADYLEYTIP